MTQMDTCFPAALLADLRCNPRPLTDIETIIIGRIGQKALGILDRVGAAVQPEDCVGAAADQIDRIAEIIALAG